MEPERDDRPPIAAHVLPRAVQHAIVACPQRYRWHLEKNATQIPAISWQLTGLAVGGEGPEGLEEDVVLAAVGAHRALEAGLGVEAWCAAGMAMGSEQVKESPEQQ